MKRPLFVRITLAALISFFVVFAVYPLICMFVQFSPENAAAVYRTNSFARALRSSLISAGLTTMISLLLALSMSMLIERSGARLKGVWQLLFIIPMLIPSVSMGTGLVVLFGNNGFFNRTLSLSFSIYGIQGIVLGHVLYTAPIAFLLLSSALRRQDYTAYEAAAVLGIPESRRFTALTLPFLWRDLIAAAFLVFSLSVTDYGVPAVVGGKFKTLASLMYAQVEGQLQFGKGAAIGICLLIPAVFSFLADSTGRKVTDNFTRRAFPVSHGRGDVLYTALCAALAVFFALPAVACAVIMLLEDYPLHMTFTLRHLSDVWTAQGASGMVNSLILSLGCALVATLIALFSAYNAARQQSPLSRCVHLAAVTAVTVPGLVLGLSYILAFKSSFLYGTMGIMILACSVHFFTTPYLMLYQTMGRFHRDTEAVGATLGIPPFRLFLSVILPQCTGTLLDMGSYFFLNSMVNISVVSFLARSANRPLSLMAAQYSDHINPEAAAALSVMILAVNLAVRAVTTLIKKRKN